MYVLEIFVAFVLLVRTRYAHGLAVGALNARNGKRQSFRIAIVN